MQQGEETRRLEMITCEFTEKKKQTQDPALKYSIGPACKNIWYYDSTILGMQRVIVAGASFKQCQSVSVCKSDDSIR